MDKIDKKRVSQLILDLKADKKLESEQRMEYIGMAELYLQNLKDNLNKTSIEMDEKVPLGVDIWRAFLNYPVVRKYLNSFRDESINSKVDTGLMAGDSKAVGIKKAMNELNPIVNNSNIVLIRLPEKLDF